MMQNQSTQDNAWVVDGRFYPNALDADRARFYRQQDADRRLRDRIVRTELGLMVRLADERFESESAMREHVVSLAGAVDDEMAYVIREAVRSLWSTGRYHAAPARVA